MYPSSGFGNGFGVGVGVGVGWMLQAGWMVASWDTSDGSARSGEEGSAGGGSGGTVREESLVGESCRDFI